MNDYLVHYNDSGEDYGAMSEISAETEAEARKKFYTEIGDTSVIINEIEED